jgi:predicted DNA-binding helix-hairpin-helix protein
MRRDATILQRSARSTAPTGCAASITPLLSPIPDASSKQLPLSPPPLLREHRLYQADWLTRFYGFDVEEIVSDAAPDGHARP